MPAPSRTYASKIGSDVQMAKNAPKYTYGIMSQPFIKMAPCILGYKCHKQSDITTLSSESA